MEQERQHTTAYSDKQVLILDATERLFAEHGYDGTSVRDIAQEAGVNVAMISYYFGSKEKLMESMFVHRISASRMSLENLVNDKQMTPAEKLFQMIDDYVDRLMSNVCFHRIFLREQLANNMTAISSLIEDTKVANFQLIQKIIQEGQRKKVFTKHVDIVLLTGTLIGTLSQSIHSQQMYRRLLHLEDMAEDEFQLLYKKKIKQHLKHLFQASLTYDNK